MYPDWRDIQKNLEPFTGLISVFLWLLSCFSKTMYKPCDQTPSHRLGWGRRLRCSCCGSEMITRQQWQSESTFMLLTLKVKASCMFPSPFSHLQAGSTSCRCERATHVKWDLKSESPEAAWNKHLRTLRGEKNKHIYLCVSLIQKENSTRTAFLFCFIQGGRIIWRSIWHSWIVSHKSHGPFCLLIRRCASQTSWLRFSLSLIYWTVSKHTPNSRLDRLNGCRNTETHYFGTERVFGESGLLQGNST